MAENNQQNQAKIFPLVVQPGIQRDGTELSADCWVDGDNITFRRGFPKKILGNKSVYFLTGSNNQRVGTYQTYYFDENNKLKTVIFCARMEDKSKFTVHAAILGDTYNTCQMVRTNSFTDILGDVSINALFSFDSYFDRSSSSYCVVMQISSPINPGVNTEIYSLKLGTDLFTWVFEPLKHKITDGKDLSQVSGGVVFLGPFLFSYGNQGFIQWSNPKDIGSQINSVYIASTKIMKGVYIRGGNNSPSGLFWSQNSLIKTIFVPNFTALADEDPDLYEENYGLFKFDTIGVTSLISPNAVIEYEGIYYWISNSKFMFYNGIIQELPNKTNFYWFFDNLNWDYTYLIWGEKNPESGEIFWVFPSTDNTICNKAIVFNVREQTWSDRSFFRSSGMYDALSGQFFAMDSKISSVLYEDSPNTYDGFQCFLENVGVDSIEISKIRYKKSYPKKDNIFDITILDTNTNPIPFFIKSNFLSFSFNNNNYPANLDNNILLTRFMPDMKITNPINLNVYTKPYPNITPILSYSGQINNTTEKIDFRVDGRFIQFEFAGNLKEITFENGLSLMRLQTSGEKP